MAESVSGMRVVDISNPDNPTTVGGVNTPSNALAVAIAGTLAYVADYTAGLQVIDISNPAEPIIVGSYDTPGYAVNVFISGNRAYVADDSPGLLVLEVKFNDLRLLQCLEAIPGKNRLKRLNLLGNPLASDP